MNNRYIKPLLVIVSFLVLSLVTTASYAYFTSSVRGNDSVNANVVTINT